MSGIESMLISIIVDKFCVSESKVTPFASFTNGQETDLLEMLELIKVF